MFGLVSRRMSLCVSLASLSMLSMSANSPSGWPGMISGFVVFVRVPLLSWNGLRLSSGSNYLCSSGVLGLPVVNVILLGSGVPMVLLARSVMAVWFYRSSSYVFIIFSFSFCFAVGFPRCFSLVVGSLLCCLALLFHQIACHQSGGESPGLVFLCVCFSSFRVF